MNVFYAQRWFRSEKRPIHMLEEQEARKLHQEKKPYIALIESKELPKAIVAVNLESGFVSVGFTDEHERIWLEYDFKEVDQGKLFLTQSVRRQFDGDTNTILQSEKFVFDPSGELAIYRKDFQTHQETHKKSRDNVDLRTNWDVVPEFGKYQSLLRVER